MWKCIRCNKENQDSEEKCINCGHGKTMDYTGHRSVSRLRPEMTETWKKQKEKPMLMADCIGDDEENGTVFGSFILRNDIHRIEFIRITSPIPRGAWDVSEDRSGKIWAWVNKSGEENVLQIGSENGVYANPNCRNLFWRYRNVKEIVFNDLFDTSRIIDANGMFGECINLTALNLDGFQMENIRDMGYMFLNCKSLQELDLTNASTDNVENMAYMFMNCEKLRELDLRSFKTGKLKNTRAMFYNCKEIKKIDVSSFETDKVEDMFAMFKGCINLEELDVSRFKTSNVKTMAAMFRECSKLRRIDVSNFETGNVEDMCCMFMECSGLEELNISNFITDKVENMHDIFYKCANLKELDVSRFNTKCVKNMSNMFKGCGNLEELDVSNFDTRSVENMYDMFNGCEKLERLDVSGFDTSRVTDMYGMFYECRKLERLDVDSFNTELVKDMGFMFCKCERLTEINVSHFKTDQVENMEAMFNGCYNLRKLDVSGFDTRKATNMKNMFSFCENLTQLDTSNFYYAPNVNVEGMFKECGVNKVQTEHNTPDFQSTSQELTVLNPDELEKLSCGSYKGNSIEELCKDFLTDSLNAQINNAGANSKWIINALEIPPEEKIYILRDEGSSFVKFSSVGFAITDRGIYMKYALSRKVIKTPWEKFMKARTIKRAARTLETDLGEIAIYSGESGSAMAKWYELRLCRLEMLFICIHKFLNANAS